MAIAEKARRKTAPEEKSDIVSATTAMEMILKKFPEIEGTPNIRYLWSNEDVHRFRVNWWVDGLIHDSKFVVLQGKKKLKILEKRQASVN